jgi:hypothetical protein
VNLSSSARYSSLKRTNEVLHPPRQLVIGNELRWSPELTGWMTQMGVTRWAANEVGGNHAVGGGEILQSDRRRRGDRWRRLSLPVGGGVIGGRFCGSKMFASPAYPVVAAAAKPPPPRDDAVLGRMRMLHKHLPG